MKKAIYSNKNQNFSGLYKVHKIEDKIIALSKPNITPLLMKKKIFIMRVRDKGLERPIFYFGLVDYSASQMKSFFIDKNVIMPAVYLLQIFFGFSNKTQHFQSVF